MMERSTCSSSVGDNDDRGGYGGNTCTADSDGSTSSSHRSRSSRSPSTRAARELADHIVLTPVNLRTTYAAAPASKTTTRHRSSNNQRQQQQPLPPTPKDEEELRQTLRHVARMVSLLRTYEERFGIPSDGGPGEQDAVLRLLTRRLCSDGVPLWVAEPTMSAAARGLLGAAEDGTVRVDFFLRPDNAVMAFPHTTKCFRIRPGRAVFHINMVERVLGRVASFGTSNETAVHVLSAQHNHSALYAILGSDPDNILASRADEGKVDEETPLKNGHSSHDDRPSSKEVLARQVLDLAAQGYGLFFLTEFQDIILDQQRNDRVIKDTENDAQTTHPCIHPLWHVASSTRNELLTRLATMEAAECLASIRRQPGPEKYYPRYAVVLYRMINSGASSVLWFNGSWEDMVVTGLLAGLVTLLLQTNARLWGDDGRLICEVVTAFLAGLVAGLVTLVRPYETCFTAIPVAVMVDYLRGFELAIAVMEVMNKLTSTGAADFIEGLVFSTLIAANIAMGLYVAERIMGAADPALMESDKAHLQCLNPVDDTWYLVIAPCASIAWAASFQPSYVDIPPMAFHAILAYGVNYLITQGSRNSYFGLLIAAIVLSASAGLFSRYTGRQTVTAIFTGLYALVPGVFTVNGVFGYLLNEDKSADFIVGVIIKSSIIGTGIWLGTLVFDPTCLGSNVGDRQRVR